MGNGRNTRSGQGNYFATTGGARGRNSKLSVSHNGGLGNHMWATGTVDDMRQRDHNLSPS